MTGADATSCAYAHIKSLSLEGQLILLCAAERADVKRYVAISWINNCTKIIPGKHESYDEFICFECHVALSSSTSSVTVKPVYVLTGVLAEFAFRAPSERNRLPEL